MREAIKLARKAEAEGEVPVGAVVVADGRIVGRGYNKRTYGHDPTAHAEIIALRRAGKKLGRWNLTGCTLYVTLEPCVMCAGAAVNARIAHIVFGAYDSRFGACGSVCDLFSKNDFNHEGLLTGGVLADECAAILSGFFKNLRTARSD